MRITRIRGLADTAGYINPETVAHKNWADLAGSRHAITRAEAYREVMSELFAPYAWPGGYPIIAVTDSGDVLCPDCARRAYEEERIDVTVDVYFEGPSMFCDECNREIESAYGDPEEEK